jgi:hypothetical protein
MREREKKRKEKKNKVREEKKEKKNLGSGGKKENINSGSAFNHIHSFDENCSISSHRSNKSVVSAHTDNMRRLFLNLI